MIIREDFESAQRGDTFIDILGQRWTIRGRIEQNGAVELETFNARWGAIKLRWDDKKGGIIDQKGQIVEELMGPGARLRRYA